MNFFAKEVLEKTLIIQGKEVKLEVEELDDLPEAQVRELVSKAYNIQSEGADRIKKLSKNKSKKPAKIEEEAQKINNDVRAVYLEILDICKVKLGGKVIPKKDLPMFVKKYTFTKVQSLCLDIASLGRIKEIDKVK